jgi:hypothetical protein
LTGYGLGIWKKVLMASVDALNGYFLKNKIV